MSLRRKNSLLGLTGGAGSSLTVNIESASGDTPKGLTKEEFRAAKIAGRDLNQPPKEVSGSDFPLIAVTVPSTGTTDLALNVGEIPNNMVSVTVPSDYPFTVRYL